MIKLPRLPQGWKERPQLFERYWDEAMRNLETSLNLLYQIPEIKEAISNLETGIADSESSRTIAENALSLTHQQMLESSIVNSYIDTTSYTGSLITCSSSGSITIKDHVRVYGYPELNPSALVKGSTISITGLVAGDVLRFYYTDNTREGGYVSYMYSKNMDPAPVQSKSVHSVGAVVVPSSGTQAGEPVRNPGFVFI